MVSLHCLEYEQRRKDRSQREMELICGDHWDAIRSAKTRRFFLTQIIKFGMVITSVLIAWKALMCLTGSETPVVVVLSGSMEPGFERGDVLLLHRNKDPFYVGEIIVFNINGREIPIVHRIIKVHQTKETEKGDILTKGDNNWGDDRPLYAPDQLWLQPHHVVGKAIGLLPYLGLVTIFMAENATFKYLLVCSTMLLCMMYSE